MRFDTKAVASLLLTAFTASANRPAAFVAGRSSFGNAAAAATGTRSRNNNRVCKMSSSSATVANVAVSLEETSESYKQLLTKLRTITQLQRASAVLHYDQMVFMPHSDRTSAQRGAQQSALAEVIHEKSTDPRVGELIAQALSDCEQQAASSENQQDEHDGETARILELAKISYEKQTCIPPELEARKAALSSKAYSAWVKAREANDFESFAPVLKECFDTAMEVAEAQSSLFASKSETTETKPSLYNIMLDEFEMGMDAERINELFDRVQEALVPLLDRVLKSTTPPSRSPLEGTFPIESQEDISRKIVTALGFDASHGRIDVSVHPFTTSFSSADVRITSRFRPEEWYQGLAGTIHEGGHAIYEQNMGDSEASSKTSGLEIDSFLSMGTHESQSLFWERHVGLSKPFWKWATPILKEKFGADFDYSSDEVYGAVNAVHPGFIRVEADELTYPLHVILRYQLERDVVEGKLDVKDIPAHWNRAMKDLLQVEVSENEPSKGCLQDIHWSGLAIGYFPTYLIGSMTAAQLAHYCRKDIVDFDQLVEKGEFSSIKAWLTDKVHRHGKRYKSLDELLEAQVGEPLNPQYFIDYLTDKYSDLYRC